MVDRDYQNSKSPTRNPNVQRSTSVVGPKLHFRYTANDIETSSGSGPESSRPSLGTRSSRLPRQSTFDYFNISSSTILPPEVSRRSTHVSTEPIEPQFESVSNNELPRRSALSPEISRRSTQVYTEPIVSNPNVGNASTYELPKRSDVLSPELPRSSDALSTDISRRSTHVSTERIVPKPQFENVTSYEVSRRTDVLSPERSRRSTHVYTEPIVPKPTFENMLTYESRIPREAPYLYGEASSAPKFHRDVPLATSSTFLSSSPTPAAQKLVEAPSHYTKNYGSLYSAYSSYDPSKRVTPADTSHRIQAPPPATLPQQTTPTAEPVSVRRSPSPARPVHSTVASADPRARRQTTTFLQSETIYLPVREYNPMSIPAPTSTPKPQSLTTQMQNTRLKSPQRRHMTIGYTPEQSQDIRQAQEQFRAQKKREEDEVRAKLEAKKREEGELRAKLEAKRRAEDLARMEERRRIEEAAKLEARRRVEESARLAAEGAALDAVIRGTQQPDEDADVEKFIKNLGQRIIDSRVSKNLKGALVGRQQNQNPAKNAENLTNALTEKVEGHDTNDQVSTQSVAADSSEVRVFLDRLRGMQIDENQNRRKYAEYCYDPEEDDSEINSLNSANSFLSTVPEEDPDNFSLENQPCIVDQLHPRVISYIHNMVDGILSSLNKTDFENENENVIDTQKTSQLYDQELYSNDTNYNYRAMSETARQFFTPQSSPIDETPNDFYNGSL